MDERMLYARDGGTVTITFNRPEKLNAFDDAQVIALGEALRRFDLDGEANVAILRGAGRAFSTGADVHERQLRSREEFEALGGPQGHGAHAGELLLKAVNWKPVIAAPHGYVMGLAVGIMLDSELIVAEEGTRIHITETSRGLGGAMYWGLTQFRGAAAFGTEVALTGRWFTAEEALAAGMIIPPGAVGHPNALAPHAEADQLPDSGSTGIRRLESNLSAPCRSALSELVSWPGDCRARVSRHSHPPKGFPIVAPGLFRGPIPIRSQ